MYENVVLKHQMNQIHFNTKNATFETFQDNSK